VWLPPSARQAVIDERQRRTQEIVGMAEEGAFKRTWDADLQKLDPRLRMLRAKEDADLPELTPGFWHVMRLNDNAPPTVVLTVKNPDGTYREPDSRVFDELRRDDMWHPQVGKDRRDRARLLEEAKERRKRNEDEARWEDMALNFKALESPSIRFGGKGWTASKKGRGGRSAK
jgi:hypothetical protein